MNRLLRHLPIVAAALFLAACDHDVTPTEVEPDLAISDGAHDGNQHFYFLPPMVPDPSPTGTFDGNQAPIVEICVWDGTDCGAGLEFYTMDTGPGSETIRVDAASEQYVVNWHTDDILQNVPIDESAGESYRIRVLIGAQELGHADVAVVDNGKELRNVDTGEYIGLLDGRTLPIKFRVEEGWEAATDNLVSAGYFTSCAVRDNGDAYCWGDNRYGQIGNGSSYGRYTTPQPVSGGHQFASISVGVWHTCGVTTGGDAYCWGLNHQGQSGTGTNIPFREPSPVLVSGGHTFATINAGQYHTCGVTTDGTGLCWGYNGLGALGTGTTSYTELAPVAVSGGHTFHSIEGLFNTNCGLTTAGDGYCWGHDSFGQTGQGTTHSTDGVYYRASPTLISGLSFQSLEAGDLHSCGVTASGDAYCWGYNRYGAVGSGSFTRASWPYSLPSPTAVTGGHAFVSISAGGQSSCAVAEGGAAWCWGYNGFGTLGDGTTTGYPDYGKPYPVAVTGGHLFTEVSVGYLTACGATTSKDAVCWGYNGYGQVGDGSYAHTSTPQTALDLDPTTP